MFERLNKAVFALSVTYIVACVVFGSLYCADMCELLDVAPGDSMMGFDAFSALIGAVWWLMWMGLSVMFLRACSRKPTLVELFAGAAALGLVVLCIRHTTSLFSFPVGSRVSWTWVLVACVLPSLGGVVVGSCIAERGSRESIRPLLRLVSLVLFSVWAGTFLWWPKEMMMATTGLVSVRQFPGEYSDTFLRARLILASGLGSLTVIVIAFSLILSKWGRRPGELEAG